MLILAEGRIEGHFEQDVIAAAQTWLGPIVDAGFLQHGYIDRSATRIWMVLSSEDLASATQRLDDLPVSRQGFMTFTVTAVTGLRFR